MMDKAEFPFGRLADLSHELSVDRETRVRGCEIRPLPTFRGVTRVWSVSHPASGSEWFVKRFNDPATLTRYVNSLFLLERLAANDANIIALREVGRDFATGMLVTEAVHGIAVSDLFVSGTRFDRLLSWRSVDIAHMSNCVVRALRAIWSHPVLDGAGLADYSPRSTAGRMRLKLDRLRSTSEILWSDLRIPVEDVCSVLDGLDRPTALMIGDVDFANMILRGDAICFVDLDDVGVGDQVRDLACLLHRLDFARRNWKYSSRRIDRVVSTVIEGLETEQDETSIACYQVELQLDAIWSALRGSIDRSLPVHGRSLRSLTQDMMALLSRATG